MNITSYLYNLYSILIPKIMDFLKYKNLFYHEIDNAVCNNSKYGTINYSKTFMFKNLDFCENTTECIKECFIECLSDAIRVAKDKKLEPERIGINIESKSISDTIYTKIMDINSNVIDTLMYTFINTAFRETTRNEYDDKDKCLKLNDIITNILSDTLTINIMTIKFV